MLIIYLQSYNIYVNMRSLFKDLNQEIIEKPVLNYLKIYSEILNP
jgi:hypothetical protein